jgi:ataxia telangiectasia mutated family protein
MKYSNIVELITITLYFRCCEEVLRVLRLNYSQLLTILEVVIHDPLYKWSLSPVQVQARRRHQQHLGDMNDVHLSNYGGLEQPTSDQLNGSHGVGGTSSQDAAQRALSRIQNKLQG